PALSFDSSKWIWTPELSGGNAPSGSRGFRKTSVPPQGKTPAFLTIAYTADNIGVLFVNGQEISTDSFVSTASTCCISLAYCGSAIVLAVNATNVSSAPSSAGLLVTAVVTYTDGWSSPIVSDTIWRSSEGGLPAGFQELSFDDSTWSPAVTEDGNGATPFGNIALAGNEPLSFTPAQWIWTAEGSGLIGNRAFRYTLTLPTGQSSTNATIILTADDEVSFYVDGVFIGTGTQWEFTEKYMVGNIEGPEVVFAVFITNEVAGGAGLLASIRLTSTNDSCPGCISTLDVFTSEGWKGFPGTVPSGFEQPGFDDSDWPAVVSEGFYGVNSWETIPQVPTTVTTTGTPLPGAPA
ncbi:hypothetical protein J3R30DRAFT_3289440, partial [Lentinula aciculospora]